ncbi:hypothetical protein [Roseiconus lacunae]|uniref:Uncharacterized protein n=1 Tax=Roseiconus lacunae TaxID=2605694 RepID=A0ABT7PJZ1_9BACT|nr:hypothetical protein [Roseiconus lacunae]MDM4016809.1 hypothetical protein [Roseiconus lacunae]
MDTAPQQSASIEMTKPNDTPLPKPIDTPEHSVGVAEIPSETDSALMAVAGYLRLCGIKHPDVLRDQSHRILAMVAKRLEATRDTGAAVDQSSLTVDAMSAAIDEVQRLHDRVAQHSIRTRSTASPRSQQETNPPHHHEASSSDHPSVGIDLTNGDLVGSDAAMQCCVLCFNKVMKDPDMLRENEGQYQRTRTYGERHTVTVIPKRIDRTMRHNATPELIPPLRPQWWGTMVNRSIHQIGMTFQTLLSPWRPTNESTTVSE